MSSTPSQPSASDHPTGTSSSAAPVEAAASTSPPAPANGPAAPTPASLGTETPHEELPLDDLAMTLDAEAAEGVADAVGPSLPTRIKTLLIGRPRDLKDESIFHHVTLVAFLAWVGLGADGLSSSCYGPEEGYHHLGEHAYLAVFLSLMTIVTVWVISTCYSHIIEEFPSGGGGYLVASKLLGRRVGVVSGCALLVDYVLTITVSIAAAGDALFGLLNEGFPGLLRLKLPFEFAAIITLIVLNLRGIKESVKILLPIFLVFLAAHAILIFGSVSMNLGHTSEVLSSVAQEASKSINDPTIGLWGLVGMLLHAYSMGAGTYTGIEAVSNSMPVMREPRVATAKRTMVYMALSLAITAGGLMFAYLLLGIKRVDGQTMNHVLAEVFTRHLGLSDGAAAAFVWVTVLSEGALLVVAAQAGFIDGPRVLANMAHDSWMPHWFANLSERLATHNGILLMGLAALAALAYTGGDTFTLVVMYSINVFLTFSLSMVGMFRHWWALRSSHPLARRRLALFGLGAAMCLCILAITVYEKVEIGGWVTLAVTGTLIGLSLLIHAHYRGVVARLKRLDDTLSSLSSYGHPNTSAPDPAQPAAAILVGGYGGLGVHTMLNAIRFAPGHFKSVIFLSAAVVDSGNFKGAGAVEDLQHHCESSLGKYVDLANRLGMPATSFLSIGTDAVEELERMCLEIHRQFPKAIFFAGQLVFQKDTFLQRLLHNQTAQSLQRRLQWSSLPMVILPTRVR